MPIRQLAPNFEEIVMSSLGYAQIKAMIGLSHAADGTATGR
jgi:hypothetical protein